MTTVETFWTTEELAEQVRVTPRAIQKWCQQGRIESRRMGREYRITEEVALRVIREGVPDGRRNTIEKEEA